MLLGGMLSIRRYILCILSLDSRRSGDVMGGNGVVGFAAEMADRDESVGLFVGPNVLRREDGVGEHGREKTASVAGTGEKAKAVLHN